MRDKQFLDGLEALSDKHRPERKHEFNIFRALHKAYDEKRLHSRFIANLLSPASSHGKGTEFLEKFLELIGCSDFRLDGIDVLPSEADKTEYKNIDICIRNDENQAIIIENKLFARDSDHFHGEIVSPQLLGYHDLIKEEKMTDIRLVYLTMEGKKPAYFGEFEKRGIVPKLIDYRQHIPVWLEECAAELEDGHLKDSIVHYRECLISITNDFDLATGLKTLISEYADEAWRLLHGPSNGFDDQRSKVFEALLKDQFKHVAWHTVHEFWTELARDLARELGDVNEMEFVLPTHNQVNATTHRHSTRSVLLQLKRKGALFFICNDSKGFSWGILGVHPAKKWGQFDSEGLSDIVFHKFENRETFEMINYGHRRKVIDEIVTEVLDRMTASNMIVSAPAAT